MKMYYNLSKKAQTLYNLILARSYISNSNINFHDQDGKAFVCFSRKEAMELINVSKPTAIKLFKELINAGFIFEERRKFRHHYNRIYIKIIFFANAKKETLPQKCKTSENETISDENKDNLTSPFENSSELSEKLYLNEKEKEKNQKKNKIYNNISLKLSSLSLKEKETIQSIVKKKTRLDENNTEKNKNYLANNKLANSNLLSYIKEQIEYDYFQYFMPERMPLINMITNFLLDFSIKAIHVNHSWSEPSLFRDNLSRLSSLFIRMFIEEKVDNMPDYPIKNKSSYIRSMLFNYINETLAGVA